jgi:TetR/AcrR family transcriptional regulator
MREIPIMLRMHMDESSDTRAAEVAADRGRRPQRRALDTRERIISAALSEFSTHGFRGTSTRTVAKLAGVQHPLVNYHFTNKEGLWRAVLAATGGTFIDQFNRRLAGLRGVDDVTKLRLVQEDFIRFAAAHPHFHMLMSQEAQHSSKHLKFIVTALARPYFAQITPLIRAAQQAGKYVNGDPHHLQYLFIGAATRIFTLAAEVKLMTGRSPSSPKAIDEHVAACLGLFFRELPEQTRLSLAHSGRGRPRGTKRRPRPRTPMS